MIQGMALSILLAIIVIAFFVVDFYFMFRYDSDREQNGKGWAWDYTLFTIFLGLVVLLQPILFPKFCLEALALLFWALSAWVWLEPFLSGLARVSSSHFSSRSLKAGIWQFGNPKSMLLCRGG